MWPTPEGERVLQGAEWKLFRRGLSELWDLIEKSAPKSLQGVQPFDELQPAQKLAMLANVGLALSDADSSNIELTACSEGTVASIFHYIRQAIEEELTAPRPKHSHSWMDLVLAASEEVDIEGCEDDRPDWDYLVECLAQRVLWDTDYAKGDGFLDTDPDVSRANRKSFGIADDYFVAIAPDPTNAQLKEIRQTLHRLTKRGKNKKNPQRPNSNRFRRGKRSP